MKLFKFTVVLLLSTQIAFAASSAREERYLDIAHLPDFDGLWEPLPDPTFGAGGPMLMTPEYAAQAQAYLEAEVRGEIQEAPAANCVPLGMPIVMRDPYPIELLITPGKITMIIEANSQWRQIFTDGRDLPEDPDLTFNGHSIGHWEDDTLVVETFGFTTATAMGRSFGQRHSDKMRIIERISLVENNVLDIETTVTDPEALLAPWVTTISYGRHREWSLTEYVCQQNNRNSLTADGQSGVNLDYTPEQ